MASRGLRKSVGVVEMARDLGVSAATVSRALALDARDVGGEPPAAGPHQVAADLRIAGSTGPHAMTSTRSHQ
jgi:hypothetical protein